MKILDTEEYLHMICGLLAEGRTGVKLPVTGGSMIPFLHHGDTVYLERPEAPLKKGDVVLYTRPSGQYVLHRIARIMPDGSFLMLGDAQMELEPIESRDQIHARAVAALHRGKRLTPKSARWRFFATAWLWLRPWRGRLLGLVTQLKKKNR